MAVVEGPIEWLIAALHDGNENVRWDAIQALRRRGDSAAAEALVAVFCGRRKSRRFEVSNAVIHIGEPAVLPLIAALSDADPDVRGAAARALEYIRDARALPALRALELDETGITSKGMAVREVVAAAIRAIEKAQQPQVIPWQLVMDGRYDEALEEYARQYAEDGRTSNLTNRGLVYLLKGEYAAALEDFKRVVTTKDPRLLAAVEFVLEGICYWYLYRPDEAVQTWRRGVTAPYQDAAGGVESPALLLYAAERLDDAPLRKEAWRLLRKHSRRKLGAWPGPIVPYLLGKIDTGALEEAARATDVDILRVRHQCQADFHVAVRALREGYWEAFQERMIRCAGSSRGLLEHEYYLARWEVQHGFPDRAFVEGR
jgi:tetratricopeptide (TPR) repeat protein